jgi:hypothetical protein
MPEKEKVFSSSVKYTGIFSFKDFYKFCHDWLDERTDLFVEENLYKEKLEGDAKSVEVQWVAYKKLTDYFKFSSKIKFQIINLKSVELVKDGTKIKTNKGEAKISVSGTLVRDYDGKFESNAFNKFLRGIYEKWVIPSRIEQMEDKIVGDLNEFLEQAKAYLDLEGRK